jgi:uncharacterized protein (UPF0335 family)
MAALSISFTVSKASAPNGANLGHNNREFIANNVDVIRIEKNIVYVQEDIRDVYNELFGEALETYNAKQTRNDRKIKDYLTHIAEGKREEAFYEIVVQFGDSINAPVGSENGKLATKLLDEYIHGFQQRNPNLRVFNAVTHLDETSPHIHINFIPFYTEERKNSLSRGVSMRAALDEQGFTNHNWKLNSLVEWEESEFKVLEKILNKHGLKRDVKNATHAHLSVEGYKEAQDERKIKPTQTWQAKNTVEQLQQENDYLKVEKAKLDARQDSPWKSFYYSAPEKQAYVQNKLIGFKIPFRETENGFEAQECYVEEIRKFERDYKPNKNAHRTNLQENLDMMIMQSNEYDEVIQRLRNSGYEVKQGKYVAAKPKNADGFIRLKSLGEEYSEQAIRNRLVHKQMYEREVDNKISSATNPDSLQVAVNKTIKHYTFVFSQGMLPLRKKNKKKPFTWANDLELDRLAELNKRINSGTTLESLRNEFARLESSVAEKETLLVKLKTELSLFNDLYAKSKLCFGQGQVSESDLAFLTKHKVKADNYHRITKLITSNEAEIVQLNQSLSEERSKLKDTSDTLTAFEKIVAGTYVQSLMEAEKHRAQSEYIRNGAKRAD